MFSKIPAETFFFSKICRQNSAKASFMYYQRTATATLFLKVPATDSLVFFSEHISRSASLTQASVLTCNYNFSSFSCIGFTCLSFTISVPIPYIPALIFRIPIIPNLFPRFQLFQIAFLCCTFRNSFVDLKFNVQFCKFHLNQNFLNCFWF